RKRQKESDEKESRPAGVTGFPVRTAAPGKLDRDDSQERVPGEDGPDEDSARQGDAAASGGQVREGSRGGCPTKTDHRQGGEAERESQERRLPEGVRHQKSRERHAAPPEEAETSGRSLSAHPEQERDRRDEQDSLESAQGKPEIVVERQGRRNERITERPVRRVEVDVGKLTVAKQPGCEEQGAVVVRAHPDLEETQHREQRDRKEDQSPDCRTDDDRPRKRVRRAEIGVQVVRTIPIRHRTLNLDAAPLS